MVLNELNIWALAVEAFNLWYFGVKLNELNICALAVGSYKLWYRVMS